LFVPANTVGKAAQVERRLLAFMGAEAGQAIDAAGGRPAAENIDETEAPVAPAWSIPKGFRPTGPRSSNDSVNGVKTSDNRMPEGFSPLKSNIDQSDQSIAQAGATAPIPKEVGRIAIGPVTSMSLAKAFIGKGEANAARPISAFITRMTGTNIDIRETPWCAAFVNAVLKGSGSEGTGKLNARSFLKFGTAADKPQTGDIAVFSRGDPKGWQGHVGFYAGEVEKDGQTYVRVIGGNQGDEVSEKLYPKARLLGYRRPPSVKA